MSAVISLEKAYASPGVLGGWTFLVFFGTTCAFEAEMMLMRTFVLLVAMEFLSSRIDCS